MYSMLGFAIITFIVLEFAEEKKYPDKLMMDYHNAFSKYYAEKLGIIKVEVEKKEYTPPEDPDFWEELEAMENPAKGDPKEESDQGMAS